MVWVKTIRDDKATGDLKRAYEIIVRARGKISNIMYAQSLNPRVLKIFLELYMTLVFGKSGLSRAERETIATMISANNRCTYCVTHHGEALRFYLKDGNQLETLKQGRQVDGTSARTKALINYAVKLTLDPGNIEKEDLEPLRKSGLNDSEILDLVLLTSYMNFVNRVASGLGVEHDEEEARGYKY